MLLFNHLFFYFQTIYRNNVNFQNLSLKLKINLMPVFYLDILLFTCSRNEGLTINGFDVQNKTSIIICIFISLGINYLFYIYKLFKLKTKNF